MNFHQSGSARGYPESNDPNLGLATEPGSHEKAHGRLASGYKAHSQPRGSTFDASLGPVSTYDGNSLFKQYKEEDGFMRGARIAEKI